MTSHPGVIGRRHPVRKQVSFCFACDDEHPFRPAFYKRMWPATRLERFLQSCGIGITTLNHALMHVRERYGREVLGLTSIRRGTVPPTHDDRCAVQLAVSAILGTLIPMDELFEPTIAQPGANR